MSAQKAIAEELPSATEESRAGLDDLTRQATPSVTAPRRRAKLADALDGRFLSEDRATGDLLRVLLGGERDDLSLRELSRRSGWSVSTVQRRYKRVIERGSFKLASEEPRRDPDPDHRAPKGTRDVKGRPSGGRFAAGNAAGSNTGKAHVLELLEKFELDEVTTRIRAMRDPHIGKAWSARLDATPAQRRFLEALLFHVRTSVRDPEYGLARCSIDGREQNERGRGALAVHAKLSRASCYRAAAFWEAAAVVSRVPVLDDAGSPMLDRFNKPLRRWRIDFEKLLERLRRRPGLRRVERDPKSAGPVSVRPTPGQAETSGPVSMRHERVSENVGLTNEGGSASSASALPTEAVRPASPAEGHTSAAPTDCRSSDSAVLAFCRVYCALACTVVPADRYARDPQTIALVAPALRAVAPSGNALALLVLALRGAASDAHFRNRLDLPYLLGRGPARIDELVRKGRAAVAAGGDGELVRWQADVVARARQRDEAQRRREGALRAKWGPRARNVDEAAAAAAAYPVAGIGEIVRKQFSESRPKFPGAR